MSTAEIFIKELALLGAMIVSASDVVVGAAGTVIDKKKNRRSRLRRIADPSIYSQSFSNLHFAINIVRHVQEVQVPVRTVSL